MKILFDLLAVRAQTKFFRENRTGCSFAAFAARHPKKYGWIHRVVDSRPSEIDGAIESAVSDSNISTLSLIFRRCHNNSQLKELVEILQGCKNISLAQDAIFNDRRCLGFRAHIGSLQSWISGFGPFPFFAITRQTPYTEIVMRVKPRPAYETVMKESPEGVIHLADMDMLRMQESDFKHLWASSHTRTEAVLGHKPNMISAAKTTFAIPLDM